MEQIRNKMKKKRGTVIIAFAYFVVLILLPLMAIGYDFAMLHVFKMHLDNIAQLSALSCQPHSDNKFYADTCQPAMAQTAALNLRIDKIRSVLGTPWQFRDESTSTLSTRIHSDKNMQTSVFSLKNKKFFELKGSAESAVNGLINSANNNRRPSASDTRLFFQFTGRSNQNQKVITGFSIMGYYKPVFARFLGKKYERIPVVSSEVTVRAVTCQGNGC